MSFFIETQTETTSPALKSWSGQTRLCPRTLNNSCIIGTPALVITIQALIFESQVDPSL